jgi:glycosyltransferase involved in cell wall biosynthesis
LRPTVSILLPVWNAAATLPAALSSLERQTQPNWECLIVDDGSVDASRSIARHFAERDRRFRLISRDHEGLIPSLNAGIELCTADLVARMDADDWMHRNRLAHQVDLMTRSPSFEAVGCFVRVFPRASLRDGRRAYERWLHSLTEPERLWRERFVECPIAHPTLMMRTKSLAELRYEDRGWPEDYDLLLRLLRRGPVAGMVPTRLHGWRDSPTRLSRTDERYALEKFTQCRAWYLSRDFLDGQATYTLWGHGPTGRALRRQLAVLGHNPSTIVDVHPRRIGNTIHGARVIPPEALERQSSDRLIVSVAGHGPRGEIRSALARIGMREGYDYVCAA